MSIGRRGTFLFLLMTCVLTIGVEAKTRKTASPPPLDKSVQKKLTAAERDMRKAGIKPKVTSTFRTSAQQQAMYKCGQSRRCRDRRGVYGANRPGTSLHEAGFAVDLGGLTQKQHGRRKLTPQGKRVVTIMNKNGFKWRYGMNDPAHFEVDPRQHGYKSVAAAIQAHQKSGKSNQPNKAIASNGRASRTVAVKSTDQKKRAPRRRTDA